MINYHNMTKQQLVEELMSRGITCYTMEDFKTEMIDALLSDDVYQIEFPNTYNKPASR